ncbi:MAG: 16S rRNA (adenine(1518)-N(6)/adenine(1519)-N(6))-dimethyltransferase RsmA [Acidimicrobiales bacterium]
MTHSRSQLLGLLDEAGITLSRALGQNYVADPNTVRRIARLAGVQPGDRVVEIGAGLGSLTLALVEAGATVLAVETDRRVAEVLQQLMVGRPVSVVVQDALTLAWADELVQIPGARPWSLVANLPYNIAATLVLDVLERVPAVESMLVMVQREVGERLAAPPGSKVYGIPSVKLRWWAEASVVGRVPATVFVPQPRVESALLRIQRHPTPASGRPREEVFALLEQAFRQRRKMLRRSLVDHAGFEEAAGRAGVRPEARPEELGLPDWLRLAEQLAATTD